MSRSTAQQEHAAALKHTANALRDVRARNAALRALAAREDAAIVETQRRLRDEFYARQEAKR